MHSQGLSTPALRSHPEPEFPHNQAVEVILAILALIKSYPAFRAHGVRTLAIGRVRRIASHKGRHSTGHPKIGRFRHRLLDPTVVSPGPFEAKSGHVVLLYLQIPQQFFNTLASNLRHSA